MKAFALNLCKVQLWFAAKMKNRFRLSFGTLSLSLSLPLPADQSDREKARLFSWRLMSKDVTTTLLLDGEGRESL